MNAVFLPVIFISGVFYDADNAPGFLKGIAEALPLKHLIDGLSAAMVTGESVGDELSALGVLARLDRARHGARGPRLQLGAAPRLSAPARRGASNMCGSSRVPPRSLVR